MAFVLYLYEGLWFSPRVLADPAVGTLKKTSFSRRTPNAPEPLLHSRRPLDGNEDIPHSLAACAPYEQEF